MFKERYDERERFLQTVLIVKETRYSRIVYRYADERGSFYFDDEPYLHWGAVLEEAKQLENKIGANF